MEGVSEHTDTGDSAQLTKPALLQRKAAQAPTQGGGGGLWGWGRFTPSVISQFPPRPQPPGVAVTGCGGECLR